MENGIYGYEYLVMHSTGDFRGELGEDGSSNENHYLAVGRWKQKEI